MTQHLLLTDCINQLGSQLRPGQTICSAKLREACGLTDSQFFAAKREMLCRGMLTEKHRSHKPALLTLHNPPLPFEQRTPPIKRTRSRVSRSPHVTDAGAQDPFVVTRTFQLAAGVYTAKQLRKLALEVLKELGER